MAALSAVGISNVTLLGSFVAGITTVRSNPTANNRIGVVDPVSTSVTTRSMLSGANLSAVLVSGAGFGSTVIANNSYNQFGSLGVNQIIVNQGINYNRTLNLSSNYTTFNAVNSNIVVTPPTSNVAAVGNANLNNNLVVNQGNVIIPVNSTFTSSVSTGALITTVFTSTSAWTAPSYVSNISAIVVAGGGGGGYGNIITDGGGGGAGGLVYNTAIPVVSGQTYSITIGAGGPTGAFSGMTGMNGGPSVFSVYAVSASTIFGAISALVAYGGGGGASTYTAVAQAGAAGGSGGGGAGGPGGAGGGTTGTYVTPTQGLSGGSGVAAAPYGGGGGGGAGTVGGNAPTGGVTGGSGGAGVTYPLINTASYNSLATGGTAVGQLSTNAVSSYYWLAGGGGGGFSSVQPSGYSWAGAGGGGGGIGGTIAFTNPGIAGLSNTGGGGGGGGTYATSPGGNGGSGIVIISYYNSTVINTPIVTNTTTYSNSALIFSPLLSGISVTQATIPMPVAVNIISATSTWTAPVGVTSISALIIGGGGGGASAGGGGGAGGLIYNTNISVVPGTVYPIIVGSGGSPGLSGTLNNGARGGNTIFNNLTALGGGYGATLLSAVSASFGGPGGSGGGASYAPIPFGFSVSAMLVAGGGGGGAGGAGAGGVVYNLNTPIVAGNTYTIAIGAGGVGNTAATNTNTVGGNTIFNGLTALGGGASTSVTSGSAQLNGGSGGGALFGANVSAPINVLLVGGGGGGAGNAGAGGGAGGVINVLATIAQGTVYGVTIGNGGIGGSSTSPFSGTNGGNTVFNGLTALGGGAGGAYNTAISTSVNGASGGSGGGGAYYYLSTTILSAVAFKATTSWTAPVGVTSVSALVVGGGGTGANNGGNPGPSAGAGAGGVVYNTNYTVTQGNSYSIQVGGGGGNSVFDALTALAGGNGNANGGSGGGNASATQPTSPSGGYGNNGGSGGGGAGGGAGAVGGSGPGYGGNAGSGGAGITFPILNAAAVGQFSSGNYYVAGGGGGDGSYVWSPGGGGVGGGGGGGPSGGAAGLANTGSGGGGGQGSYSGWPGGSGVIILAYYVNYYSALGGQGYSGQGNAGGAGQNGVTGVSTFYGGGGGGNTSAGTAATLTNAGNGGNGTSFTLSNAASAGQLFNGNYYVAGGGGGGSSSGSNTGTGGLGGGGAGNGTSGTANTGGGGGGGAANGAGGTGGTGLLVVSSPVLLTTTGAPGFLVNGTNYVYTFSATGSLAYTAPTVVGGLGLQPNSTSGGYGNVGGNSTSAINTSFITSTPPGGGGGAGGAGANTSGIYGGAGGVGLTYPILNTIGVGQYVPTTHSTLISGGFGVNTVSLSTGNSTNYQFGTGDFTIEAWTYSQNISANNNFNRVISVAGNYNSGIGAEMYLQLPISTPTTCGVTFAVNGYNGGVNQNVTTTSILSSNTWYHLAMTRKSGVLYGFINGVYQGSATATANISATNGVAIGNSHNQGAGGNGFAGYISNVRLVSGTALYTSSFTVPTAPLSAVAGTVLLTCQNPTITIDNSPYHVNFVTIGTVSISTAIVPFPGYNYYIAGGGGAGQGLSNNITAGGFGGGGVGVFNGTGAAGTANTGGGGGGGANYAGGAGGSGVTVIISPYPLWVTGSPGVAFTGGSNYVYTFSAAGTFVAPYTNIPYSILSAASLSLSSIGGSALQPISTTGGYGNAGGGGVGAFYGSTGGGGGAGQAGATPALSGISTNGGIGLLYSISGSAFYYAGGGGGGQWGAGYAGNGGLGGGGGGSTATGGIPGIGGGNGALSGTAGGYAGNGANGFGGGGGGGGSPTTGTLVYGGGAGGSGAVIIAYYPTGTTYTTVFSATSAWTCPPNVVSISALFVAGGGGGGQTEGGGGGAGGLIYYSSLSTVPGATYTVTVGAGGAGCPNNASTYNTDYGSSGGFSSLSGVAYPGFPNGASLGTVAYVNGGGGGGSYNATTNNAQSGGSGGGTGPGNAGNGGAGTISQNYIQGYAGGSTGANNNVGAGGGGSGGQALNLSYQSPGGNSTTVIDGYGGDGIYGIYPFVQNFQNVTRFYGNISNDYLYIPSNSATALSTNNFTLEGWHYFTKPTANTNNTIYSNYATTFATTSGAIYYGKHTTVNGNMSFWSSNYSTAVPLLSDAALPTYGWMHYAVTRYGNVFTMYRNGTFAASATYTGSITLSSNFNYIGANGADQTANYYGLMHSFRIVIGYPIYISNFLPSVVSVSPLSAISGTQLLVCQTSAASAFNDYSVNNFAVSARGLVTTTLQPVAQGLVGFGGGGGGGFYTGGANAIITGGAGGLGGGGAGTTRFTPYAGAAAANNSGGGGGGGGWQGSSGGGGGNGGSGVVIIQYTTGTTTLSAPVYYPPIITTVTSTSAWTSPGTSNYYLASAILIGGGGGGGSSTSSLVFNGLSSFNTIVAGGGGGAGNVVYSTNLIIPASATYTFNIGTSGVGGTAGSAGGTGGTTSLVGGTPAFNYNLSAIGGGGGGGVNALSGLPGGSGGGVAISTVITAISSYAFTYASFTSASTWTCPTGVFTISATLIGGGGGAGYGYGGGGGAGGVVNVTTLSVTPGVTYPITIGTFGTGATDPATPGNTGGNTIFNSLTAFGGGGGGSNGSAAGTNGGSGGGSTNSSLVSGTAIQNLSGVAITAGTGANYGNNGGVGYTNNTSISGGGGGGGAGGAGSNANYTLSGSGGAGITLPLLNIASVGTLSSNGNYYVGIGGNGGTSASILSLSGSAIITATGTWTTPAGVTSISAVVVGGGGGGGSWNGPGGGAGGLVLSAIAVTPGTTYPITIGPGGTGNYNGYQGNQGINATNGGNTVAFGLTALGGGYASTYSSQPAGNNGGSGGGAWSTYTPGNSIQFSTYGYGLGNAGGTGQGVGNNYSETAGGGGGAGSAGGAGGASQTLQGTGGAGVTFAMFNLIGVGQLSAGPNGNSYYLAGGGGAGGNRYGGYGLAGAGGGGVGAVGGTGSPTNGGTGLSATGGGGGGAGYSNTNQSGGAGGNGGSGVVAIYYVYNSTAGTNASPSTGNGGNGCNGLSAAPGGNGGSGAVVLGYNALSINTASVANITPYSPGAGVVPTNTTLVYNASANNNYGSTSVGYAGGGSVLLSSSPVNTYSYYFNGTNSYLSIPTGTFSTPILSTNGTSFGSNNFTIEFWVYATATPGAWTPIFSVGSTGGGQELRIGQNINSTGYGMLIPNNTNNGDSYTQSNGALPLSSWHHMAMVRNGSTMNFYLDGVLKTQFTGVSFYFNNTGPVTLGYDKNADGYFNGYISNVRILNNTALYTTNFALSTVGLTTPFTPIPGSTALLTCQASALIDSSGNNFPVYNYNSVIASNVIPFSSTTVLPPSALIIAGGAGGGAGSPATATTNTVAISSIYNAVSLSNTVLALSTVTYYNSGIYTLSIPANVVSISAVLIGAGGSGGKPGGWTYGSYGGAGGYTSGILNNLLSGTTVTILVGGGGQPSSTTSATGGGGIACPNNTDNVYGGGGGGYTGIFLGNNTIAQSTAIMIAGGGGGGGSALGASYGTGNGGGAGGGLTGQTGLAPYTGKPWLGGNGGTQIGPGALVTNPVGINTNVYADALYGGSPQYNSYGGAGGGGWFGGSAGGYDNSNQMGGGGGGSSYINPAYVLNGVTYMGNYNTLPVVSNVTIPYGAGNGGSPSSGGSSGLAILIFQYRTAGTYAGIGYTSPLMLSAISLSTITVPAYVTATNNLPQPNTYSVNLNGGRVQFPASSAYNLGNNTFTLEFWLYPYAAPTVNTRLITIGPDNSQSSMTFNIGTNLSLSYSVPSLTAYGFGTTASSAISLSSWNHIAFVANSATGNIFVNGVSAASSTGWNLLSANNNYFYIGYDTFTTASGQISANISNLKFTSGSALYVTNFVPSTTQLSADAYTKLLTFQGPTITDNSLLSAIPSYTAYFGTPYVLSASPFYYQVSSVGYYVAGGGAGGGAGSYTGTTVAGGGGNAGTAYNSGNGGAATANTGAGGGGAAGTGTYSGGTGSNGVIVFAYQPVSAIVINTNYPTLPLSATLISNSLSTIYVAASGTPVNITNNIVNGIGNTLSLNYTPGLSFTYTYSGIPINVYWGTTNTVFASAYTAAAITPYTGVINQVGLSATPAYSYSFNGTTDYLSLTSVNGAYQLSSTSTPFTVEGWVYPTAAAGGCLFVSSYAASPITIALGFGSSVGNLGGTNYAWLAYYNGTAWTSSVTSPYPVQTNVWTHIAGVFTGNSTLLYVNGVQVVSAAGTSWTTTPPNGNVSYIGRRWDLGGSNFFQGYMSNVRFTNGYALYTNSTFPVIYAPLSALASTTLLTCNTSAFRDTSSNNYPLYVVGSSAVSNFNPFTSIANAATYSNVLKVSAVSSRPTVNMNYINNAVTVNVANGVSYNNNINKAPRLQYLSTSNLPSVTILKQTSQLRYFVTTTTVYANANTPNLSSNVNMQWVGGGQPYNQASIRTWYAAPFMLTNIPNYASYWQANYPYTNLTPITPANDPTIVYIPATAAISGTTGVGYPVTQVFY